VLVFYQKVGRVVGAAKATELLWLLHVAWTQEAFSHLILEVGE
jgi:hypothetical protein